VRSAYDDGAGDDTVDSATPRSASAPAPAAGSSAPSSVAAVATPSPARRPLSATSQGFVPSVGFKDDFSSAKVVVGDTPAAAPAPAPAPASTSSRRHGNRRRNRGRQAPAPLKVTSVTAGSPDTAPAESPIGDGALSDSDSASERRNAMASHATFISPRRRALLQTIFDSIIQFDRDEQKRSVR
jgi:hypothetical protein